MFLNAPVCNSHLHHLHLCMQIYLPLTHSHLFVLLWRNVRIIWDHAMQSCMCCDGFCRHVGRTSTYWRHWPSTYRSLCPTATGWQPCTCCADLQVSLTSCRMPTLTMCSADPSAALFSSAREGMLKSEQYQQVFCMMLSSATAWAETIDSRRMTCMHGSAGHIWLKLTYTRRGPQLPQP